MRARGGKKSIIDARSSQVTLHPPTAGSEVAIGKSTLASWLVCCQNFSLTGDDCANRLLDTMMEVTGTAES